MLGLLILMLFTVIPVKIGAELFGASNKELKYCVLAVFIGTVLSTICALVIGDLLGLFIAYCVVSMVYSRVFLFSFGTAFVFTFVVFMIQVGLVQMMADIGIFTLNLSRQ
ncbi:hypothetical protein A9267_05960 [Shewanella sp. UCD-FRSSP16_17]|uniref:hypothetical protein n=1 Tax=Shewanella sp. UCD-FRSSP16_17 TaxID=1853256 RepID=UPI0007EEA9F4|nr:hypothetical protein [Shewanella sp. UCD-FRSSP16_17]OBT10420.1 hypothetical protein A9267_05960 [Shewanella sp. UCD-FRSSP16_17]